MAEAFVMSFSRHGKSVNPMYGWFQAEGEAVSGFALRSHRFDELAAGYSLAICSPALPASALPAGSMFHQPVESVTNTRRELGNSRPAK
jgi:hypothetical protein